ncbi:ATP-binding protein [Vibrio sp. SCSIO 43136]|uniref:ATP-binding protein n=1 Tax=Vibrio sp. SCSIO 43136 TaxID=2819101 RepID=UPI002075F7A6|nr:ATP-binding protein [Vibrio sp. SCSIO 43136]USD63950.1 ATP-binding protein [Vibrio sp. SCSIO 43136]
MKQKLILIRGLPGSGKSTLAQTMDAQHLEADMFFIDREGNYRFEPSLLSEAHQWCQNQTRQLLKAGESVVVSNTFVQQWEMKPYLKMAKTFNVELEIHICRGKYQNIHGVSQEVIASMKRKWQE